MSTLLSEEQHLEIERAAEFRHEYLDGGMYAMSGGRDAYPDVVVACNERRFLDERRDSLLNPTLICKFGRNRPVEFSAARPTRQTPLSSSLSGAG